VHRILIILFIARTSFGQCANYNFQSVAGPNCGIIGPSGALGFGLSASGAVCGYFANCESDHRAFVWPAGGGFTPIAFPIAIDSAEAYQVNQFGMVVGDVDAISQSGRRGFVYQSGTTNLLPPLQGHIWSEAHGLSDGGIVVGASAGGSEFWAVSWNGGVATRLLLPLGPTSVAEDINESNQICGWMGVHPTPGFTSNAFIWHNGATTDLGIPQGAFATTANAINNLGDACGFAIWPCVECKLPIRRPCAWINDQFIDLGTLPGLVGGVAFDINDAREIVGYCLGDDIKPFIWRNGVMHDLNDLVPDGTPLLGIARAINNSGQITGQGHVGPPNAHSIAFLLTPALPQHAGDVNCDATINVNDLLQVIVNWNPPGPVGGNPADLNRDNKIDQLDIIEVVLNWVEG